MKRLLRHGYRAFAFLCAMTVAPVLGALLLAWSLDLLPPLERVWEAWRSESPGAGTAAAAATAPAVVPPPEAGAGAAAPADGQQLWYSRLKAMSDDARSSVAKLDSSREELAAARGELEKVAAAAADYLTLLLGRTVGAEQVVSQADQLCQELRRKSEQARALPRLITSLGSMDPESLARILVERAAQHSNTEEQDRENGAIATLLAALPPNKVARVLEALGNTEPSLAGRLIDKLHMQ